MKRNPCLKYMGKQQYNAMAIDYMILNPIFLSSRLISSSKEYGYASAAIAALLLLQGQSKA
jgi:hypothetical protein